MRYERIDGQRGIKITPLVPQPGPIILKWSRPASNISTRVGIMAREDQYRISDVDGQSGAATFPTRVVILHPEYSVKLAPRNDDCPDYTPGAIVLRHRGRIRGEHDGKIEIEQLPPDTYYILPMFADETGPVGINRGGGVR